MVCVYVMSVCVYFKLPIEVKGQFFKKDFIFMSGGGGGVHMPGGIQKRMSGPLGGGVRGG